MAVPSIKVPYIEYDELRVKAKEFHADYNVLNRIPTPIDQIAEFGFEIDIIPMPGLESNFDVVAFISDNLREISIDENVFNNVETRYRFSIAHELSHVVLHSDIFKDVEFKTIDEWKEFQTTGISEKDYSRLEWQANNLAALILVPEKPLRTAFREAVEICKQEQIDPFDESGIGLEYMSAFIAKEKFSVWSETVRWRIERDSLMSLMD